MSGHQGPFQPALLVLLGLAGGILLMIALDRNSPSEMRVTSKSPNPVVASEATGGVSDPETLIADALRHEERDARTEALLGVAKQLAAADRGAGLALSDRIPDEDDKIEFMRALFAAWAAREPRAAIEYVHAKVPAGAAHNECLAAVIEAWASSSPREAWEWLDANISGPIKEEVMGSLATGWVRSDPAGAAAWFVSSGSTAQSVLDTLVSTWAELNPRSAATWVESLIIPESRETARVCLASAWVQRDPAAAAKYFAPFVKSDEGADIASVIVNTWGATDPEATSKWISRLPPGSSQQEAARALASIWPASDVQRAVEWAETVAAPELKAVVVEQIATTWGTTEPRKAIDWLATLAPDTMRREGTRQALNSWAVTDPQEMKSWLSTQSPGDTADAARVSLGEAFLNEDPAAALQLALGIADPAVRNDCIERFHRHWREEDSGAAARWLKENGNLIPAELRKQLGIKPAR